MPLGQARVRPPLAAPPAQKNPPAAPHSAAGGKPHSKQPLPRPGAPLLAVLVYHVADASGVLHLPAKPVMHRSAYSSRLITRYTVASPACQPNRATRGTSPRPPLKPHFTGRKRGLRGAMAPRGGRFPPPLYFGNVKSATNPCKYSL